MIKVYIYGGEAFPVYIVHKPWKDVQENETISISQEQFDRWKQAFENFSLVQQEIVDQLCEQKLEEKVWGKPDIWEGFHYEV